MDEFEKYKEEQGIRRGCTESYVSAMKRRLNLQAIGNYIRDGSETICVSNDSFHKREDDAYLKLKKRLIEKSGEEAKDILIHINDYLSVLQEIYFSLGMKAGAILHCKLTDNFETDI